MQSDRADFWNMVKQVSKAWQKWCSDDFPWTERAMEGNSPYWIGRDTVQRWEPKHRFDCPAEWQVVSPSKAIEHAWRVDLIKARQDQNIDVEQRKGDDPENQDKRHRFVVKLFSGKLSLECPEGATDFTVSKEMIAKRMREIGVLIIRVNSDKAF